jgi:hypothetical protein
MLASARLANDARSRLGASAGWLTGNRRWAVELAAPVAAVSVVLLTTHRVAPAGVGAWGLITVTPWPVFISVAALSVSFAAMVRRPCNNTISLGAHVLALALLLHGLPSLLEREPRFATAWLHVGFVSAILEYHHPLGALDARFSWPGFFTAIAALVGMTGAGSAVVFLRWTPLALNIAYLLPVFVIARALLASRIRAWLVLWLFVLTNWVGQDYFSPQGVAYFFFLAILAVLAYAFTESRKPPGVELLPGRLRRVVTPPLRAGASHSRAQRMGLLLAVTAAAGALGMSHQLTPVVLALDVTVLVLARQCSARYLPLLLWLMVIGWLSYAAVDYWSGHLGTVFASGGSSSVSANVNGRFKGSAAHVDVVYLRVLYSVLVWLFALAGLVWAWRRKRAVNLTVLLLAVVPLPLVLAQSYGGEAQLRLYLYTFPFMLMLGIGALPGSVTLVSRRTAFALAIATPLMAGILLVARFGNEQFEQITPDEVTAAERMYEMVPKGATLVAITPNVVWRYRRFDSYTYRPNTFDEFELGTPRAILNVMGTNPIGSYLLITRAQTTYASVSYGLSANWGMQVEQRLSAQPQFHLIYQNPDARLYQVSTGVPAPAGRGQR